MPLTSLSSSTTVRPQTPVRNRLSTSLGQSALTSEAVRSKRLGPRMAQHADGNYSWGCHACHYCCPENLSFFFLPRSHAVCFYQVHNTLDPLLAALTHEYVDDADLTARLNALYKVRRIREGGNITELDSLLEGKWMHRQRYDMAVDLDHSIDDW